MEIPTSPDRQPEDSLPSSDGTRPNLKTAKNRLLLRSQTSPYLRQTRPDMQTPKQNPMS